MGNTKIISVSLPQEMADFLKQNAISASDELQNAISNRMSKDPSIKDNSIKIMCCQMNATVGDVKGNKDKIVRYIMEGINKNADLIVFPEMALVGYPIQDLIFDNDLFETEKSAINEIAAYSDKISIIFGAFWLNSITKRYENIAICIENGKQTFVKKRLLPTYNVFDERRYFDAGNDFIPVTLCGINIGILICEDLWDDQYDVKPAYRLWENGAELLISINGSPYVVGKENVRIGLAKRKVKEIRFNNVPLIYLNLVGGQDELTFDGNSFICNGDGSIHKAKFCSEDAFIVNYNKISKTLSNGFSDASPMEYYDEIMRVLTFNLREYYEKTGAFKGMVLGLSGGIDSALVAYIASKTIDPKNVLALLMPTKFSSKGSIDDSIALCKNIGIKYQIVSIEEFRNSMTSQLEKNFDKMDLDIADQNVQARIRGNVLMYYSNAMDYMLLNTGNKSEIATGYCTLYGDTNGAKAVIGDLYKTEVFEICRWINRNEEVIPKSILNKPPSAELKIDQVDQDNLPPYIDLDRILRKRIDDRLSPREIVLSGERKELVDWVERLYTRNEYKRAQLCQTIKIHDISFGIGRKIPVVKRSTY